jgi:hypothetical protein
VAVRIWDAEKKAMIVGDTFGTLEVVGILYRTRRDGTQGAPVLVDVRCKCGAEKTVLPATLARTKNPLRSCGDKGCRTRRPAQQRGAATGPPS